MDTGGYKYLTKAEAEEANRIKARERYKIKREEILSKRREDPILKEKRRQKYHKQKEMLNQSSQKLDISYYLLSNNSQEKIIKTTGFIIEIV